jgi:hypothetical protein
MLVLACVRRLIASVAVSTLADLRVSAAAMACCAQMDYACTGMSAPDDCCRRMNHTPARAAAGMLSSAIQLGTSRRRVIVASGHPEGTTFVVSGTNESLTVSIAPQQAEDTWRLSISAPKP